MSTPANTAPVFILGQHRSGTSILYKTLVERGGFCHPTPFHLAHFDAYLQGRFDHAAALARTRERFERRGITDRFVDDIPAHALSPEEYGFVLAGGRITPATRERFERFCEFVRGTCGSRRLLLKNPRDLTSTRYIHQTYPEARFVLIHRHPGPTIESRIRELRLLFSRRSPYQSEIEPGYDAIMRRGWQRRAIALGLRPQGLVRLVFLHAFHRQARRLLRDVARLPAGVYTDVTYEDLCAEPQRVIRAVLDFLGLPDRDLSGLERTIRARPAPGGGGGVLRSAGAARLLAPYLAHCGYRGLWPDGFQSR